MYDVTMEGANIDQAVLMTLVMERLPGIWAKFSGGATSVEMDEGPGLPTVTLVTSHWFLTLFINILPVEVMISSFRRTWMLKDCGTNRTDVISIVPYFVGRFSRSSEYGIVSFMRAARSCSEWR